MDRHHPVTGDAVTRLAGAGVELAASTWGDPSDPPVVFLHGAGQSRQAWAEVAGRVAANGWYAVAVDHRGHGDSEWPEGPDYDWHHFAGDATAIAGSFDRPPVMIGASLGGVAALLAQRVAPRQLYRALVLVDVTPRLEPEGVRRIVGFMAGHPEGFASLEEASTVIAAYTGRPKPASPDGLRQVLRRHEDGRWRWHWDVRFLLGRVSHDDDGVASVVSTDIAERLMTAGARAVKVPTLVVRGAQSDLVSPAAAREVLALIPGSRYVDVADASHMVAGDQNDRFGAAVVDFLTELT
jgi:pimeloyl-ACP methyl ester carboxylesterase